MEEVDGGPIAGSWVIGHEEMAWEEPVDRSRSRRAQLAARGPYQAAIPTNVASLPVPISPEVAAESVEATTRITRFDATVAATIFAGGELSPLDAVLLRTESASSSQIEHITAGAQALALATIGEKTGPNANLVATNSEAMRTAIDLSDDPSVTTILNVHKALLHDASPTIAGKLRQRPVWIGHQGSTPHTATFVPPKWERVEPLLEDLVHFTQRLDIPPLVQAAVAHAQFETIHPFDDGNGRVGRALVHSMLRAADVTLRLTVPISAGLLHNVDGYYRALGSYRAGQLDPIVAQFSEAAFAAVSNGHTLINDLEKVHSKWVATINARTGAAVWRALPHVIAQPAVSVNYLSEKLEVTFKTAQTAIDQMVAAGVLRSMSGRRRNRVWVVDDVTEALDAFADRSRRR